MILVQVTDVTIVSIFSVPPKLTHRDWDSVIVMGFNHTVLVIFPQSSVNNYENILFMAAYFICQYIFIKRSYCALS